MLVEAPTVVLCIKLSLCHVINIVIVISCTPLLPPSSQMDPKLRPSFPDIVKHLEEILARLKVDEMEHEGAPLSGDNDKKTTPNGNSKGVMQQLAISASVSVKPHLHLMSNFLRKRKEADQLTIPLYASFACRPFVASSPLHTGSSCTPLQCRPVSVKPGGNFPLPTHFFSFKNTLLFPFCPFSYKNTVHFVLKEKYPVKSNSGFCRGVLSTFIL